LPWTVHLDDCPMLSDLRALRYLSLSHAACLNSLEILAPPMSLASIDLSYCVKLKRIVLVDCPGLLYLNLCFCLNLEYLEIEDAPMLSELDLSLLVNLEVLKVKRFSPKKLILNGCDKLTTVS